MARGFLIQGPNDTASGVLLQDIGSEKSGVSGRRMTDMALVDIWVYGKSGRILRGVGVGSPGPTFLRSLACSAHGHMNSILTPMPITIVKVAPIIQRNSLSSPFMS